MKKEIFGNWSFLPDVDLLKIFSYLDYKSLVNASYVCSSWYCVSNDEFLWKDLFITDWKINKELFSVPKNGSWKAEYIRLSYHAPSVHVNTLSSHNDEVLHIAFSHNGEYFSTCSKDSYIKLWRPDKSKAELVKEDKMSTYGWNYTQFSQFNSSDTLLMVSGVFTGFLSTSGEIIVFNIVDGFTMQCRIPNKPYDVFGTWYNENYLLAGNIHILEISRSCSSIWLNKAWQEAESEHRPVLKRLFKFQNKQYSSIRSLCVTKCWLPPTQPQASGKSDKSLSSCSCKKEGTTKSVLASTESVGTTMSAANSAKINNQVVQDGNVPTVSASNMQKQDGDSSSQLIEPTEHLAGQQALNFASENIEEDNEENSDDTQSVESSSVSSDESTDYSEMDFDHDVIYVVRNKRNPVSKSIQDEYKKFVDSETKLLIFTCGSQTYTPHKIGFKRIEPFKLDNTMNKINIANRLAEKRLRTGNLLDDYFDTLDEVLDFRGHIIGMAPTPDERYLYVNCRSWPEGAIITDALRPPPIAQEIEIHVVDLMTLERVGRFSGNHKAFTPNDDCFFIFLDVCEDYVASGAEDRKAYMWDRHYNVLLNSFSHDDVVNCVAFNPNDSETLLTVSDDAQIKIWMSRRRVKEYGIGEPS